MSLLHTTHLQRVIMGVKRTLASMCPLPQGTFNMHTTSEFLCMQLHMSCELHRAKVIYVTAAKLHTHATSLTLHFHTTHTPSHAQTHTSTHCMFFLLTSLSLSLSFLCPVHRTVSIAWPKNFAALQLSGC